MAAEIQSLFLEGPAGRLEALLNSGAGQPRRAALLCHPHPMYGGTMHNKVVYHAMKALNGFGYPVLRINFRGTGLSEGEHDFGRGEQDDVRAALTWLRREFGLPIVLAGFSFGASMGLRTGCAEPDVAALISLGTPLQAEGRHYRYSFLSTCVLPKLFVSGAHDQYGPVEVLRALVEAAAEPKRLVLVDAVDHFFEPGGLPKMRTAIEAWVRQELPG